MGRLCSKTEGNNTYNILGAKQRRNKKHRRIWKKNIKSYSKVMLCAGVE